MKKVLWMVYLTLCSSFSVQAMNRNDDRSDCKQRIIALEKDVSQVVMLLEAEFTHDDKSLYNSLKKFLNDTINFFPDNASKSEKLNRWKIKNINNQHDKFLDRKKEILKLRFIFECPDEDETIKSLHDYFKDAPTIEKLNKWCSEYDLSQSELEILLVSIAKKDALTEESETLLATIRSITENTAADSKDKNNLPICKQYGVLDTIDKMNKNTVELDDLFFKWLYNQSMRNIGLLLEEIKDHIKNNKVNQDISKFYEKLTQTMHFVRLKKEALKQVKKLSKNYSETKDSEREYFDIKDFLITINTTNKQIKKGDFSSIEKLCEKIFALIEHDLFSEKKDRLGISSIYIEGGKNDKKIKSNIGNEIGFIIYSMYLSGEKNEELLQWLKINKWLFNCLQKRDNSEKNIDSK